MVVLLQARHHAVESIKLNKACTHELVATLVCTQTNLAGLDLFEVLLDLLLGCRVREVAWELLISGW